MDMDYVNCSCNPERMHICPNCGAYNFSNSANYIQLGTDNFQEKQKDVVVLSELSEFRYTDEVKIAMTLLYHKATQRKTKRNAPRRAIIFCCIVIICKERSLVFNPDEIQLALDLKTKDINKAIKDIEPIIGRINTSITIEDIIKAIMKTLNMRETCLDDIIAIYESCKKVSPLFNSSKIETLAYGLVYYYLVINLPEFNQDFYFEKSKIAKDTVLTISSEIQKYMKKP